MRLPFVAFQQCRAGRFSTDDAHIRARHFQHFADAGQSAATAPTTDEIIQPLAGEIAQDFGGGGAAVIGRVGGIGELTGPEPTVFFGKFLGFFHHAGTARGGGGQDDFGTVGAHGLAALDGEGFGHHRHEFVAACRRHHRQRNAGVAGGGFHNGIAWLQQAALFGIQHDPQRQPVLDRATGIEGFGLHIDADMRRCQPIEFDDGGVADGGGDAVVEGHVGGVLVMTNAGRKIRRRGQAAAVDSAHLRRSAAARQTNAAGWPMRPLRR